MSFLRRKSIVPGYWMIDNNHAYKHSFGKLVFDFKNLAKQK